MLCWWMHCLDVQLLIFDKLNHIVDTHAALVLPLDTPANLVTRRVDTHAALVLPLDTPANLVT